MLPSAVAKAAQNAACGWFVRLLKCYNDLMVLLWRALSCLIFHAW